MLRSKKFIVVAVLAAVVLVGSIGGVALAQTEDGDDSLPEARYGALLDRVCEIYEDNTGAAINPQDLDDAFAQARNEMREAVRNSHLRNLVEEGTITQEQADEFSEWQQSRPDMPFKFGFGGRGGHHGFPGPCFSTE